MIKSIELVIPPEEAADEQKVKALAASLSGMSPTEISVLVIKKRSIDARSRNITVRLVIDLFTNEVPEPSLFTRQLQIVTNCEPVVVIGSGPAGLFAAIRLIELGFRPIIVERGKNVKERRRDLADLNKKRIVNPDSNYCFGEGGAGTYSDGKLYTRSDKRGNIKNVLDTFIQFGASPDIAIDAHPHIGTNKLPGIIESMRKAIEDAGGTILFSSRFTGFELRGKHICGVRYINTAGTESETTIETKAVILATGHSARDVFEYLHQEKILIEAKPLAIGVRIEHPQQLIDKIQYHCDSRSMHLPPAAYGVSAQSDGRGVYSFCMCPGGIIAVASTAPGELVVNGWSPSKRNNPFANSGMVVSVGEPDFTPFQKDGELRALRYQASIEQKAFAAGGHDLTAPAQRMMDFIAGKNSATLPTCSYIPGLKSVSLADVLPKPITAALREGLTQFGKKMRGYGTNEAVLVATESRTSSPVRIPRDKETLMHPEIGGFFPCGEGAGYAGGIVSAAIDGEKVAAACVAFLHHSKRN
ncbi:MAG: FAD-binding protein [Bacteroidetes bacterium]|nr:FAD-binding protein [Bacteroidota bacterium]